MDGWDGMSVCLSVCMYICRFFVLFVCIHTYSLSLSLSLSLIHPGGVYTEYYNPLSGLAASLARIVDYSLQGREVGR